MRVLRPRQRSLAAHVLPDDPRAVLHALLRRFGGLALVAFGIVSVVSLATWSVRDPSLSHATSAPAKNLLGSFGAALSDLLMQLFGLGAVALVVPVAIWGWRLARRQTFDRLRLRLALWVIGVLVVAAGLAQFPTAESWPLPSGLGGAVGDLIAEAPTLLRDGPLGLTEQAIFITGGLLGLACLVVASGFGFHPRPRSEAQQAGEELEASPLDEEEGGRSWLPIGMLAHWALSAPAMLRRGFNALRGRTRTLEVGGLREILNRVDPIDPDWLERRSEPALGLPSRTAPAQAGIDEDDEDEDFGDAPALASPARPEPQLARNAPAPAKAAKRAAPARDLAPRGPVEPGEYALPPHDLLAEPKKPAGVAVSIEALNENARALEGVLDDFGVRGQIINVRPGPVVTLYELEPAPGIKSSRVIGLADDIARSMSAVSARVAVVPGRNVIGIELPNPRRETVYLRELLAAEDFTKSRVRLPLCLGKTIGGEPVIAELARMPHLLIAGTTGSGKSVAINTMILSLLYRLKPEECRLIMVDPKMLELSIYDGIPHLLTPVVTDPKKAVIALKWAVREMEERYRKMSKLGVRNIDGYNARVAQALEKGEAVTRTVQTGFDKETGEAVYEQEVMDLGPLPYVVVIVDEMADLMLVAGKDIEGAIQRLAQMARAAGIHLIMATQRPSVDVITGTIKANFPTRISFQVTSKIDSRTILGEMGAEQLLGQGDMLYMAGGGRISRVHGPFVSDEEVERVVAYLKTQGAPDYLDAVVSDEAADGDAGADDGGAVFDKGAFGEEGADLYDQAVAVVLRDKKCSTSYIQRRLQIGYNRAASLVERMEREGLVGPANHAGKREILVADTAEAVSA